MSYTDLNILSNEKFIGNYRTVLIGQNPVLCEGYSDPNSIGSPRGKIFDGRGISNIISLGASDEDTFKITGAPVLIGKNNKNYFDGVDFYNYSMQNIFPQDSSVPYLLPLVKNITLSVGPNNAAFNFEMVSDGIRFPGYGLNPRNLSIAQSEAYLDFDANQVRPAYNSDFIVAFGPYRFLVKTFNYSMNLDVRSLYPVNQTIATIASLNDAYGDANNIFQFLAPGKMTVNCSGQASAQMESDTLWTNYSTVGYDLMAMQTSGQLNVIKQSMIGAVQGNQFELFLQNNLYITPIFNSIIYTGIQMESAYFTTFNLNVVDGEMTIDFNIELNATLQPS